MSAIDTFRRAMRRHEKRARRMGWRGFGSVFAELRAHRNLVLLTLADGLAPHEEQNARDMAADFRSVSKKMRRRVWAREYAGKAWLWERAADAVARLRDGLQREREQAEAEYADYPYVCPECYCVGPEPHALGCAEALRELPFGPADDDDDLADDDCEYCGFAVSNCQCDNDDGAWTA